MTGGYGKYNDKLLWHGKHHARLILIHAIITRWILIHYSKYVSFRIAQINIHTNYN